MKILLPSYPLILLSFAAASGYAQNAPSPLEPGLTLGAFGGYYRYNEPPKFAELESKTLYGISGALQMPIHAESWQGIGLRIEGRALNATANYQGSGTSKDENNWLAEGRLLVTQDWAWGDLALSPYIGYGYRYLRNDGETTSTGALGYSRESQYHYLPVGTYARIGAGPGDIIAQLEYGQLLRGYQFSAIGSGVNNTQNNGYHLRAALGYQLGHWTVGPYGEFWKIDDSSVNCSNSFCGYEPKNFTREAGLQASYHFGGSN
jgi:hypothetical protein